MSLSIVVLIFTHFFKIFSLQSLICVKDCTIVDGEIVLLRMDVGICVCMMCEE